MAELVMSPPFCGSSYRFRKPWGFQLWPSEEGRRVLAPRRPDLTHSQGLPQHSGAKSWVKGGRNKKGWELFWVSTRLHFQANFELICHSPGFQILCIFSSPCLFKARKEGRARKFYKEWKHISDSCEQLLIFLTYNFLITVNRNNLHDNIPPPPHPQSMFKEP